MDNASNNDTMIEHLEALLEQDSVDFNPLHARMRCMPHTVHLAALEVSTLLPGTHPHNLIKIFYLAFKSDRCG